MNDPFTNMAIGILKKSINSGNENKFKKEHEKFRETLKLKAKYNNTQFDVYSQIWDSLMEVKISIDELWLSRNWSNRDKVDKLLEEANEGFIKVRAMILKKSIFINKDHLEELKNLFPWFKDYYKGKSNLRDLRFGEIYLQKSFEIDNDVDQIQFNEIYIDKWNELLEKIEEDFIKKVSTEN